MKYLLAAWFGFCIVSLCMYAFFGIATWQGDVGPGRGAVLGLFHIFGLLIYPIFISLKVMK